MYTNYSVSNCTTLQACCSSCFRFLGVSPISCTTTFVIFFHCYLLLSISLAPLPFLDISSHNPPINIIIIFDTVVRQKRNIKHKKEWLQHGQRGRHTLMVGNVKIAVYNWPHYGYIHMQTFRTVWLLCNLSLDGKLCLCDVKNAAFV